jgi:hypothetical protein
MTESLSPLTIGLTVAGVVTVIVVIAVVLFRAFREVDPVPGVTLPQGDLSDHRGRKRTVECHERWQKHHIERRIVETGRSEEVAALH